MYELMLSHPTKIIFMNKKKKRKNKWKILKKIFTENVRTYDMQHALKIDIKWIGGKSY